MDIEELYWKIYGFYFDFSYTSYHKIHFVEFTILYNGVVTTDSPSECIKYFLQSVFQNYSKERGKLV